jgi:hypothetical protein
LLLPTFDSTKNQEKKKEKIERENSKYKRIYMKKKPKRLLKLMVKDQITSGKVGGPKCTKLL